MPKLPIISGQEVIKAVNKLGYEIDHQTGSHIILRNKESSRNSSLVSPACFIIALNVPFAISLWFGTVNLL